MKKILVLIFAICLCLGVCACGEEPEVAKSVEAQKADELILAIGEVSLESEAAIVAANVYYDTLSDEQKAQVENFAVLESAVSDLEGLKKTVEYKEIYTHL